jgi:predicted RNA-binding protein with PIN domain
LEGFLLVDGYNVLNAWPELQRMMEVDLEQARDRLITMLSEFDTLNKIQVYLIFDGHQVKGGLEHRMESGGITIIYTREGESADNWLERFAAAQKPDLFGNRTPVYVVTYDWLVQRIIAAQGAYRVTPTELLNELKRLRAESKKYYSQPVQRDFLDEHLSENVKDVLEKWRRRKD